jgi:hypothetical protein
LKSKIRLSLVKMLKKKKIVFSSACNCKKLDFFFIFRFKIVNDQNKYWNVIIYCDVT